MRFSEAIGLLVRELQNDQTDIATSLPTFEKQYESLKRSRNMSETRDPLVSVIIPNYNYAKYLREAVDSALSQTYSEIEVIVVDDGSNDESKQIIEIYGSKITAIFQSNQGVSAARNNGVAASSGAFIAFLDADDVWYPSKIELQVVRFLADQEVGLMHVGVQDITSEGVPIAEHSTGLEGKIAKDILLFENGAILGGGSGIMIPRRVFDNVGGFDEKLSTSADWDFFLRIATKFEVGFEPAILLQYRYHRSNMHGNLSRMEREMTVGFEKAFDTDDESVLALKRRAMGNFHRVMAGSYFRAGDYGNFLRHTVKSLWNRPSGIDYFLRFPIRKLKRSKSV